MYVCMYVYTHTHINTIHIPLQGSSLAKDSKERTQSEHRIASFMHVRDTCVLVCTCATCARMNAICPLFCVRERVCVSRCA